MYQESIKNGILPLPFLMKFGQRPCTTSNKKNFKKKIRVGLTLCLFIKKEAQTRVSRIGNGVHYNDYPYKYSNVNCNDVNDNDYTKLK